MKNQYLDNEEFRRVKTFMFCMNLYELTLKQKQSYLLDKRLTFVEKEIVRATILLKDCQFPEIIDLLTPLSSPNELIESQRMMILGMAYNNSGESRKAVQWLNHAANIFHKHKLDRYEYYVRLQLFFVHFNLKEPTEMAKSLDKMQDLGYTTPKDHISLLRCQFNYSSYVGNFAKAKAYLAELESKKEIMHHSQIIPHLVDRFSHHVRMDDFKKCESTLLEMKEMRRYNYSPNYKFMKSMLGHLLHREPIYLYEKDFVDCPLLLYQIQTIQALESGDRVEAMKHWSRLHEMSPEVYTSSMEYKGDKCLFSVCFAMYEESEAAPTKSLLPTAKFESLEEHLLFILKSSKNPVRKEDIYSALWNDPMASKDEYSKLSMMVSRLKRKTGLNIISRKGCYLIETVKIKKVS